MKVEHVTVGKSPMFRITLGERVRTAPAGQALAMIREAIRVEQDHQRKLQHTLGDAQQAVKGCIATGRNATEDRAQVSRLQADIAGSSKAISAMHEAIGEVEQAALEHMVEPLRQQSNEAVARVVAALPAIPSLIKEPQ